MKFPMNYVALLLKHVATKIIIHENALLSFVYIE
jgi:hypothetical protein